MLKLTRKQELALIDLGLQRVIETLISKPKSKSVEKGRKWSTAQRNKFKQSMKKKWAAKKAAEK